MLLALVSIIHIIFIILKNEKLRRLTKCLIIPAIFAVYIAGGGKPLFFVVSALALGWIGDIMLAMRGKKRYFMLGFLSFLSGHICYVMAFISVLGFFSSGGGRFNVTALAVYTPLAAVMGFFIMRLIKPRGEKRVPMIIYMVVIEIMIFWGLEVSVVYQGLAGILILSGCASFLISDTLFGFFSFRASNRAAVVSIMLSYILAQTGIILGIMSLPAAAF
jgi:uncharacterized membrane protein YhhN